MTAREKHLAEIEELKKGLRTTKSKYSRRDYIKGIKRKQRELRLYDRLRRDCYE